MQKYWKLLLSQVKLDTAYSLRFWAGAITSVIRLVMLYAFWQAVYENRTTIVDISLEQMLTYSVLAVLLSSYIAGAGTQLAAGVLNGDVAIELMRPYDYINKLISLDLGSKLTSIIRETLPMLVVALLFIGIQAPHSWEHALLFLFSALTGILIGAQIDLVVGLLSFWTINISGLRILRASFLLFFSGTLVPITLFPQWLQIVCTYMPFPSMVFVPVSIYTGQIQGADIYPAIGLQLLWLLVCWMVSRLFWLLAKRRITIFGG